MKEKIISTSYHGTLCALMDKLGKRKIDLSHRHIVIVPDRTTLTVERALCDRFGGAFDVNVTTWSRLVKGNSDKYLSRQGSVMIIRRILAEKKHELVCYKKSAHARGFASKLYESISQLAVSEVTPDEVRDRGGARAVDIALVYEEYLKSTEGQFVDSAGRMRLLRNYLENSNFLENSTIYIACFDSYTKQMENIIEVMEEKAKDVYVFDTQAEYSFGEVELYSAPSAVFSAKAIVTAIAENYRLYKENNAMGAKYEETCIVTNGSTYELTRLLAENGIPYSASETLALADHPLGRFLVLACSLPLKGYREKDVVRLAKNPLSGVDKADADCLERYVNKYAITYKLFLSPFTLGSDEDKGSEDYKIFDSAERARRIIKNVTELFSGGILSSLNRLIDYAEAHKPKALTEADEGRANAFDKARNLASLATAFLFGADDKTVFESIVDGMTDTELSARPKLGGAVEIGSEKDFRARVFKRVFVADFSGDNHPMITQDGGLISDEDIEALRAQGIPLSPTTDEVNKRAEDEFFLLLASAPKVTLIYSDKPGSAIGRITAKAEKTTRGGTEQDRVELDLATDAREIIKYCPTKSAFIEKYLLARASVGDNKPLYYAYAEKLVGDEAQKYVLPDYPTEIKESGELMLSSTTKVSQLETYFACPMKHYFRYGLALTLPETAKLEPVDVGSVLHYVAEKYVSVMNEAEPEESALKLLKEAIAESGKSIDANEKLINTLSREAIGMCKAIFVQSQTGEFKPVATEQEFGFNGSVLQGIKLNVNGKEITLRGKIDRIDRANRRARVIDYKTGNSKFSLTSLRHGLKIQLLIYLAVLIKAGYTPAGAFYFSTLSDFDTANPFLLEGVCVNDEETLKATDPSLAVGKSNVVKVKTNSRGTQVENGVSLEDIMMLADYAVKIAEKGAEEIADGYIAPTPSGSYDVCAYCEYYSACGYEGEKRKLLTATLSAKGKTNAVD